MFKKLFLLVVLGVFLVSCATVPSSTPRAPQEVVVKVQAEDPTKVTVKEEPTERVNKSMEVPNPEGRLSQLSFISKDKAFVKIFSGLSVADVTRLWNDLVVLENNTEIRDVNLFINSPGGDAFSGLALRIRSNVPEERVLKSRRMPPALSPVPPYRFLRFAMSAWPRRGPFSWCTKLLCGNGRGVKPLQISDPRMN